jgi:hypothetical protein
VFQYNQAMAHDEKFEDIINKYRDEAIKAGYMNFNLHFNVYKQEICAKINNSSLDEIEMAMLNDHNQDGTDVNQEAMTNMITNKEKDKDIVRLLVNK